MALVRNRLIAMLSDAILPLLPADAESSPGSFLIELDIPNLPQHGDYATNVALSLTRQLRRNPRDIAAQIVANLRGAEQIIARTEIAGPGFINFFIQPAAWHEVLLEILNDPKAYGSQNLGQGKRVQVEFVSANPTGPLHIGHGRGAATGDVLANILAACGYRVEREYYINDAGNQMDTLGRSLYYRYRQLLGEDIEFPEGHYQGDYMRDLAREFAERSKDNFRKARWRMCCRCSRDLPESASSMVLRRTWKASGCTSTIGSANRDSTMPDAILQTIEALTARGLCL